MTTRFSKRGLTVGLLICAATLVPGRAMASVAVPPGSDLATAVAANPSGTTFQLQAGRYLVPKTIKPKANDVFIGMGRGRTILVGSGLDGFEASSASGVQVRSLTMSGFRDAIRLGPGGTVSDVESGPNAQTGVQVSGDNAVVSGCYVHDNGRFGIFVNHAGSVQVTGSNVVHNHTNSSFADGGGIKVTNGSLNVVVRGNTVTGTLGHGIWTDDGAAGTQILSNTITGSSEDGIQLEKSYNTVVSGNRSDNGLKSLNSSGGQVSGNTLSASGSVSPLVFAGNGAKNGAGVEFANVNNRASSNNITLTGSQTVGVTRTAGTTKGNTFVGDTYHVPSATTKWFRWWNGSSMTKLDWTGWHSVGQDLTGSIGP